MHMRVTEWADLSLFAAHAQWPFLIFEALDICPLCQVIIVKKLHDDTKQSKESREP